MKKKTDKQDVTNIECDGCGLQFNESDEIIVVYNIDSEFHTVKEMSFRHYIKCDDRAFHFWRHIRGGIDDLMEEWEYSPYNYDSLNHPSNKKEKQKRMERLKKTKIGRELTSLIDGKWHMLKS